MSDQLEMYKILNNVKPYFKKSKFPYTHWTQDKIIYTQKKIKLVFSKDNRFYKNPSKKKYKGGNLNSNVIIYIV